MKLQRNTYLPLILLIYLVVMACISYGGIERGEISLTMYILTILSSLCVIVALYYVIKRRDKLRREREDDIKKNQNNK